MKVERKWQLHSDVLLHPDPPGEPPVEHCPGGHTPLRLSVFEYIKHINHIYITMQQRITHSKTLNRVFMKDLQNKVLIYFEFCLQHNFMCSCVNDAISEKLQRENPSDSK